MKQKVWISLCSHYVCWKLIFKVMKTIGQKKNLWTKSSLACRPSVFWIIFRRGHFSHTEIAPATSWLGQGSRVRERHVPGLVRVWRRGSWPEGSLAGHSGSAERRCSRWGLGPARPILTSAEQGRPLRQNRALSCPPRQHEGLSRGRAVLTHSCCCAALCRLKVGGRRIKMDFTYKAINTNRNKKAFPIFIHKIINQNSRSGFTEPHK